MDLAWANENHSQQSQTISQKFVVENFPKHLQERQNQGKNSSDPFGIDATTQYISYHQCDIAFFCRESRTKSAFADLPLFTASASGTAKSIHCVRAPVQGVLHAVNQHDPWMATGESILHARWKYNGNWRGSKHVSKRAHTVFLNTFIEFHIYSKACSVDLV